MQIDQLVTYWQKHKDSESDLIDFCLENDILLFIGKVNWGENCVTDDFWKHTYVIIRKKGFTEILFEHNLSGNKINETVISLEDIEQIKQLINDVVSQKELPIEGCDGVGCYILSYVNGKLHTTTDYGYPTVLEQKLLDTIESLIAIDL